MRVRYVARRGWRNTVEESDCLGQEKAAFSTLQYVRERAILLRLIGSRRWLDRSEYISSLRRRPRLTEKEPTSC
jgi:hypothetical protein